MRICERPRKRSASDIAPSSVSKRYGLVILTHGKCWRFRANSSLWRVSAFSALRSLTRAASHSFRDTTLCFDGRVFDSDFFAFALMDSFRGPRPPDQLFVECRLLQ